MNEWIVSLPDSRSSIHYAILSVEQREAMKEALCFLCGTKEAIKEAQHKKRTTMAKMGVARIVMSESFWFWSAIEQIWSCSPNPHHMPDSIYVEPKEAMKTEGNDHDKGGSNDNWVGFVDDSPTRIFDSLSLWNQKKLWKLVLNLAAHCICIVMATTSEPW